MTYSGKLIKLLCTSMVLLIILLFNIYINLIKLLYIIKILNFFRKIKCDIYKLDQLKLCWSVYAQFWVNLFYNEP